MFVKYVYDLEIKIVPAILNRFKKDSFFQLTERSQSFIHHVDFFLKNDPLQYM